MGYKRSVRVLFVDGGSGAAARAVVLARELGEGRLEVRGAAVPDEEMLGWADLVVRLRKRGQEPLPEVMGNVRRDWKLPESAGLRDEVLSEKVRGLVGGLRLMARDGDA